MSFAGDLQKLPIADVFQSINQNSLSGALAVRDAAGERLVSFVDGMVSGCADVAGVEEDVGDELIRQQRVTPKDVKRSQSRFFKRKGTLKRSLSRRNKITSGEFDAFTRQVVLERVYELFLLEQGTFEFLEEYDEERFSIDERSAGLRISPSEILMEAMRRVDEWGRIRRSIPSFKEVYIASREPSEEDEEIERSLLSRTQSGDASLDAVLLDVPFARFRCCEAVLGLIETGALRVATGPEYLSLGKAAEARGDLASAADFYERGLHYERGNGELNNRLISVLERLDRKEQAAAERKVYAGTLLENGDVEQAGAQFAAASRLAPSDPLPLERLFELQIDRERDVEKARATAKTLSALYLRLGLGEKAKGVYPRVLALRPQDRELRERQAEIHEQLNDGATGATIYKALAQEALKRKDVVAAQRLLERALELTPDDAKAQALLEDVLSGRYAAQLRRRRWFVAAMVALILCASGGAWLSYEAMALAHLRGQSRLALAELHVGCEGALAAIEILEASRTAYPRARASDWALEMIQGLGEHYASLARHSGETVGTGEPSGDPLTRAAFDAQIGEALDPKVGETLKKVVSQAEELLDAGKPSEASTILATVARPRLLKALDAIQRADPAARRTTAFEIDLARVRDLLPAFHLAWGEASLQRLPQIVERLKQERAALRGPPPEAASKSASEAPAKTAPAKTAPAKAKSKTGSSKPVKTSSRGSGLFERAPAFPATPRTEEAPCAC